MLEDLWCNEPCVKFSKLVPKDTYMRENAAIVFSIPLGKCYCTCNCFPLFKKIIKNIFYLTFFFVNLILFLFIELHAEKKLVLQQTEYCILRIWKYEKS